MEPRVFLDAAGEGESFYIERIDLAPKLRKIGPRCLLMRPFSGKKYLTNFLTLTHQISLLADFTHFEHPFSLPNSETTYSAPFKSFLCI